MKIGKRLKHIESMVTTGYDHIWDCCCDHGLLGATLLSKQAAPFIHFVDIVPELIHQLENKLNRFSQEKSTTSNSQWLLHCMDVSTLPLKELNGNHLVIIAGVGGDLMTQFVKAIYQNNPNSNIDFLLCPVLHQFTLRQQLIEFDLSLKAEILVVENKRFYEILLVSTRNNFEQKISPAGNLIWQCGTSEQLKNASDYLKKTISHYKRIQLSKRSDIQHIIDIYSKIEIKSITTESN